MKTTKERLSDLFNKIGEAHAELCLLANEIDTHEIWQAEGSMQDVKAHIRTTHSKLN